MEIELLLMGWLHAVCLSAVQPARLETRQSNRNGRYVTSLHVYRTGPPEEAVGDSSRCSHPSWTHLGTNTPPCLLSRQESSQTDRTAQPWPSRVHSDRTNTSHPHPSSRRIAEGCKAYSLRGPITSSSNPRPTPNYRPTYHCTPNGPPCDTIMRRIRLRNLSSRADGVAG